MKLLTASVLTLLTVFSQIGFAGPFEELDIKYPTVYSEILNNEPTNFCKELKKHSGPAEYASLLRMQVRTMQRIELLKMGTKTYSETGPSDLELFRRHIKRAARWDIKLAEAIKECF